MKPVPVLLSLVILTLPVEAHAYIDPNAGGLWFQFFFPLLVAIATVGAMAKRWLITLIRGLFARLRLWL